MRGLFKQNSRRLLQQILVDRRLVSPMRILRRQFLSLVTGAAALPSFMSPLWADAYPTRPVRIIINDAPGGAPDVAARLISEWLSERLGQPFIVENRPGGGGNIGTEAVVSSNPRWLYTSPRQYNDRHQRHYLQKSQFQCGARYRASRGHCPRSAHYGGQPVISRQNRFRSSYPMPRLTPANLIWRRLATEPDHFFGELFKMMAGF